MTGSWKEAREIAVRDGVEQVFHDFDTGTFGVCRRNEKQGHFAKGCFVEHRCICMPSALDADELEKKERAFLDENPDWLNG